MSRPSILPKDMRLVGDVTGAEDLVILGTLDGEITLDGTLIVEEGGVVRGNVQAEHVIVRGVMVGDATASETIRVDETGKMVGDLHAPRVNIVKGAQFRGHVHMTGTSAPSRTARRRPASGRRSRRRQEAPTQPGTMPALDSLGGPTEVDLAAPHPEVESASTADAPNEPSDRGPVPRKASEERPPAARSRGKRNRRQRGESRTARKAKGETVETPVAEAANASTSGEATRSRRGPPPKVIPSLRRARGRRRASASVEP
ncbi:MAG: polymer-forming cytoskeletal protein [Myxococcota bacterium]